MALLHLARPWARRHGRRLLALTVDHDLHADSAGWTAFAGEAAAAIGADWRSLRWTGPKPIAGLPAAARRARHALLADTAREAGAGVILFAHTRHDIAEADLMRAEAAPTLGYLRDWSPSPVWPAGRGVFILRPLLGTSRATLRDYLRAEGRSWLDDPTNDDLRFARTRARRHLENGTTPADSPPARRCDLGLAMLARASRHSLDGRIEITQSILMQAEERTVCRFLSIAVVCAAGAETPPRGEQLGRLAETLRRQDGVIATLAGARIVSDGETVRFSREAGDMARDRLADLTLRNGEQAVWDGRFEIRGEALITVAALSGRAGKLPEYEHVRLSAFPAAARRSLPLVLQGGEVLLPQPFGNGPAYAHALAGDRFAGACGLITHERDISQRLAARGMAQAGRSSYVEALALA